ncbi:hypothetical protein D3C81_1307620 [compost metagenome]
MGDEPVRERGVNQIPPFPYPEQVRTFVRNVHLGIPERLADLPFLKIYGCTESDAPPATGRTFFVPCGEKHPVFPRLFVPEYKRIAPVMSFILNPVGIEGIFGNFPP